MDPTPPDKTTPDAEPAAEAPPRSRVALAATVVVTIGVMAGMVAWGLQERARTPDRPGDARRTGLGRIEADRRFDLPPGCENEPGKVPKIVFDLGNDVLDVGAMRQGQVLVRDVVLRNAGDGALCLSAP